MSIVELTSSFQLAHYKIENKVEAQNLDEHTISTHFSNPTFSNSESTDNPSLILATVPGQGIHLYEVTQQLHINSWAIPTGRTLLGAAKIKINSNSTSKNPIIKKLNTNKKNGILSETASDNGSSIETEISSLIDTKDFHLLDHGYFLYALIAEGKKHKSKYLESKTVWIWEKSNKRIEVKLDHPIHEIFPIDLGSGDRNACLIIFKNGQIKLFNSDLSKVILDLSIDKKVYWSSTCLPKESEFINHHLENQYNRYFFILCEKEDKETFYILGLKKNKEGVVDLQIITYNELETKVSESKSICFHHASGRLALLDEKNELTCIQLNLEEDLTNNKKRQLNLKNSIILLLPLDNIQAKDISEHGLKTLLPPITFISKDHVLILGSELDSETNIIKSKLLLWDIKLSVMINETYIGETSSVNILKGKKHSFSCQLGKINNKNILISSLDYRGVPSTSLKAAELYQSSVELLLTPFTCPIKSNLLSSLNRLNNTIKYISNQNNSSKLMFPPSYLPITVVDSNICQITYPNNLDSIVRKQVEDSLDIEKSFLEHIKKFNIEGSLPKADFNQSNVFNAFKDNFYFPEPLNKNMSKEELCTLNDDIMNKLQNNWFIDINPDYFQKVTSPSENKIKWLNSLPPRYVTAILDKMTSKVNEQENIANYSPKIMFSLIQGSKVTSSTFKTKYGGILPFLILKQDWFNIRYSLLQVKDISEQEIIELLKDCYIRYSTASKKDQHNAKNILHGYLNLILNFNFDAKLIIFSLPLLNEQQVILYFNLLTEKLNEAVTNQSLLFNPKKEFFKIYELLSGILDVHFTYLVSAPEFNNTLSKTMKMIHKRIKVLNSFNSFEAAILSTTNQLNIKRKQQLRQDNSIKKRNVDNNLPKEYKVQKEVYKIETFNLF